MLQVKSNFPPWMLSSSFGSQVLGTGRRRTALRCGRERDGRPWRQNAGVCPHHRIPVFPPKWIVMGAGQRGLFAVVRFADPGASERQEHHRVRVPTRFGHRWNLRFENGDHPSFWHFFEWMPRWTKIYTRMLVKRGNFETIWFHLLHSVDFMWNHNHTVEIRMVSFTNTILIAIQMKRKYLHLNSFGFLFSLRLFTSFISLNMSSPTQFKTW